MVSFSQLPAAAAGFIILYFTHLEGGNVLAALVCLALAHRAKKTCGKLQQTGVGVMGVVTVEHGNTGRIIAERRANEWRDRRAALMKLYTLGPKAFKRRFKMTRPLFARSRRPDKADRRGGRPRQGDDGAFQWLVCPGIIATCGDVEVACRRESPLPRRQLRLGDIDFLRLGLEGRVRPRRRYAEL